MCLGLNPQPHRHQLNMHPTEPLKPAESNSNWKYMYVQCTHGYDFNDNVEVDNDDQYLSNKASHWNHDNERLQEVKKKHLQPRISLQAEVI